MTTDQPNQYSLSLTEAGALRRLVTHEAVTTAYASDHAAMLALVRAGYATASEPLEAIRQAAGRVPGVYVPSDTFPIVYTVTPEGQALYQ